MTTNNKISLLINRQVPFFVRNDHLTFVKFLEKYYEYVEQNEPILSDGKVIERIKNFKSYIDIDKTFDELAEKLYQTYTTLVPNAILADRKIILKNIKDFYRAKGTEKSVIFFAHVLTGKTADVYYPKKDILRASDGKWYIQKTIRVKQIKTNNVANNLASASSGFLNRIIKGLRSNSTATVESVETLFLEGTRVFEISLSGQNGQFIPGETIYVTTNEKTANLENTLSANIFSDILNTITITNPGANYNVGDYVIIEHPYGLYANAQVESVTQGFVTGAAVVKSGAGFEANSPVYITGDGSGATILYYVDTSGNTHPNSYNIVSSTISLEADTAIGNATYSNLNSSISDPANNWIQNSMSFFVYANVGPIRGAVVNTVGSFYYTAPTVNVSANSIVQSLGIIGKLQIYSGGTNYSVGDILEFVNLPGSYGTGALANVKTVDVNGKITKVQLIQMPGHIIGGSGYNKDILPVCNVVSATGTGANIAAVAVLGDNELISLSVAPVGGIKTIKINDGGSGYNTAPTINLTQSGSGNATAIATVIKGLYTYPGRYINDDGHISAYNFLQDRDYYQNFSYVVGIKESYDNYMENMKKLVHPSGTKVFNRYVSVDDSLSINVAQSQNNQYLVYNTGTYSPLLVSGNPAGINLYLQSHSLSVGNTVYIEFTSGNVAAQTGYSGPYQVSNVWNTNTFGIYYSGANNSSGNALIGIIA